MDAVLMLVAGFVTAAVLGAMAGRLARGDGPRGLPIGDETREGFWRRSLPWPTGVQEDSEIAWHVPPAPQATEPDRRATIEGSPIPPTRPQGRLRLSGR
jgi:hypothetical protein